MWKMRQKFNNLPIAKLGQVKKQITPYILKIKPNVIV